MIAGDGAMESVNMALLSAGYDLYCDGESEDSGSELLLGCEYYHGLEILAGCLFDDGRWVCLIQCACTRV